MFKKFFFALLILIFSSQIPLKAHDFSNVKTQDIANITDATLENFSEQDLAALEKIIEESPELQKILGEKEKANFIGPLLIISFIGLGILSSCLGCIRLNDYLDKKFEEFHEKTKHMY